MENSNNTWDNMKAYFIDDDLRGCIAYLQTEDDDVCESLLSKSPNLSDRLPELMAVDLHLTPTYELEIRNKLK